MAKNNKNNIKEAESSKDQRNSRTIKRNKQENSKRSDTRDVRGTSYRNDFSWYSMGDVIDRDVYDYSINGFAGTGIDLASNTDSDYSGLVNRITDLASIMTVEINPSPGVTQVDNVMDAPINRNGYNLFTQLSSVNAKTTSYGPQDLTIAILAVGELLSMHSFIQRTLALPYVYNFRNRSFPINAVTMSGIDYQDLKQNLANYRTRFNLLCALADSIHFPSGFNYYKKCAQMYSYIFMDCDTAISQVYLPVPHSTWVLSEIEDERGSKLTTRDVVTVQSVSDSPIKKMSEILDLFEEQITALLNSSTLNYVYADINNYATKYGMELFHLPPMAETYGVPVLSAEQGKIFLNQIMNASILGNPIQDSQDVFSDPDSNGIMYNPVFMNGEIPSSGINKLVNFYEYPAFDKKGDYVAFAAWIEPDVPGAAPGDNTYSTRPTALPDHYVVSINMRGSKDGLSVTYTGNFINRDSANHAISIPYLTHFNYAPIVYMLYPDSGKGEGMYSVAGIIGDIGYYTVLNKAVRLV